MAEPFEIRNADDLFHAIQMIELRDWPEDQAVLFNGWPTFEITLQGKDFAGGIPTRMMPALLEFQHTVRRAYARSVGKSGHVKRLTSEERKQSELIVRLGSGSTTFWSPLDWFLNNALTRRSGEQAAIVILGVAAIVGIENIGEAYIESLTTDRQFELVQGLSEEETKRFRMIVDLAEKHADIAANLTDMRRTLDEVLRRLDDDDRLLVHGKEIATGREAKKILRAKRGRIEPDRVKSVFEILTVDSRGLEDGFRVRIRNVETEEELLVDVPEYRLSLADREAFKAGQWDGVPLQMEIELQRRGDTVVWAELLSVERTDAGES